MALTQIEKKVAIVTGGSGGIGKCIATHLASCGISVVVGYAKSKKEADDTVHSILDLGGDATAIQIDVTKNAAIKNAFQSMIEKYGHIDYVINNAGVIIPTLLTDITDNIYENVFNVNVRGALNVMQEAACHLREGGSIVNISSTLVTAPIPGVALYTASKAALESFSRVLAKELGNKSITVNAIRVGATIPGMFAKAPLERQAAAKSSSPFQRLGTPQDIANVVGFLISDQARWITGQILTADGGAT